jgi:hypothetical protein
MKRFFGGSFFEKFPAMTPAIFQMVHVVFKPDRQNKKSDAEITKSDLDKGF